MNENFSKDTQIHLNEILSRFKLKVTPLEVKYQNFELGLVRTPIDGLTYAKFDIRQDVPKILSDAQTAFLNWRQVPAPKRGELISEFTTLIKRHKSFLSWIITFETGKIISEASGEVQEVIDMGEYATGLSRQLHGLTIASERYQHRIDEIWQPLGVVGIITAFNFPMAVWAWNAMLAIVCGNSIIWKPHPHTPLSSLALQALFEEACHKVAAPKHLNQLVWGDAEIGESLVKSPLVKLISATGSTQMGLKVQIAAATQLKKTLLELGGNNAAIVTPRANLDLALKAITFGACGTAGQRCTSLRRLFVHQSIFKDVSQKLIDNFRKISVGNPFDEKTLIGPLFSLNAYEKMQKVLANLNSHGTLLTGGHRYDAGFARGYYVHPALVQMTEQVSPMTEETFAPILYIMSYQNLDEAIALNNSVCHGLSSAIFTDSIEESMTFLGPTGSDCGIANVNTSTSGAEIGAAFGGEKMTGSGREAGSDSWKQYMRRQSQVINYSVGLPLSQGVDFEI